MVQGTSTEKFHTHHIAFEFEIRLHDDDASGGTPVGNGGFRKATDVDLDVSPSKCKSPHMAEKKPVKLPVFMTINWKKYNLLVTCLLQFVMHVFFFHPCKTSPKTF